MLMPDVFADIVPGVSAAGFSIGQSLSEFNEVIANASRWDKSMLQINQVIDAVGGWLLIEDSQFRSPRMGLVEEKNPFTGRSLYFGRGTVKLHFNGSGLIDYIEVGEGYKGLLYGTIGIGGELSSVSQYFETEYDSVEERHFPVDDEIAALISFYAEEESLTSSPNQRIHWIFVTRH